MVNGITTIISRSAIPEKLAEVADRSSENKQLATTVVVQQEAEKAVKTVQKAEHIAAVNPVRAKKEKEEREKRKKRQVQDGQPGSHLDLEA